MKSLRKRQKQSLETLLWNPPIQPLYKSTPLTADSPFHCCRPPSHLSQFILQTVTHARTTKPPLAIPWVCYGNWSPVLAVVFSGNPDWAHHFAIYILLLLLTRPSRNVFQRFPPFTEQTVWQVLPNNGQQNTDTVTRLTEVRVNIAGTPNQ